MLINFSNTPHSEWDSQMLDAAIKEYTEIIDIEFPKIEPEWTKMEIMKTGRQYYFKIKNKIGRQTDGKAIYIMGERTFAFAMTTLFRQSYIKCIYPTFTEKEGIKNDFVRFREYI